MTQQPASYPDAEIRGKIRHWKEMLARRYRHFNRAYEAAATKDAAIDLCKRSSREGRSRAFAKVARAFGDGVTLEGLRLDGDTPLAVWSILKPRDSVLLDKTTNEPKGENCITVEYVLIGAMPAQPNHNALGVYGTICGQANGLWSLEIPDHAAGRMLHRVGTTAALATIIAQAHSNLLRLRFRDFPLDKNNALAPNTKFLVPAGPGGFKCELFCGQDISDGLRMGAHAKAHTAITEDMLHDDQMMMIPDGEPGERLVDGWLLPKPVRRFEDLGNGRYGLCSWIPGLPDLLVSPKGRA